MPRWRRPEVPEGKVAVEPHPTADQEARVFDNGDDRRLRQAHAHELGLLKAKQGWIGRVTGSANESFNNGILVLLMLLAGVLAAEVGESYNLKLDNVVDTLLKAIYIVIGYIFGSRILPHSPRE